MKIVISGGTGFVGGALIEELAEKGHRITVLTRNPSHTHYPPNSPMKAVTWDAKTLGIWAEELNGADAIINLAGEPLVGKRWTAKQKARLRASRLDSTRALVDALRKASQKPRVLINASAVGYYGPVESETVTESHPKGHDFLADTCEEWEKEALKAETFGLRVVCMRFGIILEKNGGALAKMLPPFQFFIGGPLGSGKQWLPWIHRADVIGGILFSIGNPKISGPVNFTAPNPATMKDFCKTLAQVLHRPSWAPVPGFILKILLGEMSSVLLTGQKAVPAKFLQAGFAFRYPELREALVSILKR
ncbi:MAG: TIGR01777 family protein [Candidatus Omnitrophica bacterium]|nr:TIGR01777 family protein [Candidatus Omnitrophota bacterium]